MELVSSKGAILGVIWGHLTTWPWEPPKGPMCGGECFAPCLDEKSKHMLNALCASTAKLLLRWYFGVRRGHVEAKFHDFQQIVRWHPTPLRNVLLYPLWLLDVPLMILGRFHDHWFFMISWCWNPRTRFSQGWFFDLEGRNGIHGLLTCCSSFPR